MNPCIRGCTHPVDGTKQPRPAETGRLCARTRDTPDKGCADRLLTTLRDIAVQYTQLDTDPAAAPRQAGARTSRQKISGSPAGARLDVIVMQDDRSRNVARHHEPEDAREHEPASTYTRALTWADQAARDLNLTTIQLRNLPECITFLTGPWYTNICYLDWIDDLYQEAVDLHRTLKRLNGHAGPRPIGQCQCGANLYQPTPQPGVNPAPDRAVIECRQCGHSMNALAIIRLAALQRSTVNGETP